MQVQAAPAVAAVPEAGEAIIVAEGGILKQSDTHAGLRTTACRMWSSCCCLNHEADIVAARAPPAPRKDAAAPAAFAASTSVSVRQPSLCTIRTCRGGRRGGACGGGAGRRRSRGSPGGTGGIGRRGAGGGPCHRHRGAVPRRKLQRFVKGAAAATRPTPAPCAGEFVVLRMCNMVFP